MAQSNLNSLKRERDDAPLSFKRTRTEAELAREGTLLPLPNRRICRSDSPPLTGEFKSQSSGRTYEDDDEFTRDISIKTKLFHVWPKQSTMTQFDIAELPDPSISSPPVPGSHCWLILGPPPTGSKVLATIKLSFLRQLQEHAPQVINANNVTINFPPFSERQWYVEAVFTTVDGYLAARTAVLKWRNRDLRLTRSTALLEEGKVMLKFTQLRSTTNLSDFLTFLNKALQQAVILNDMWVEYTIFGWKQVPVKNEDAKAPTLPRRSFTGTVMVLAEYLEGNGPKQVPGFLRYDELDQRVEFYGRGERCHYCKNSPTRVAHTYRACTWKSCYHCSERGHTDDDCPERKFGFQPQKHTSR